MAQPRGTRAADLTLHTQVTDDLFEELSELMGARVVHVNVWPDLLADALGRAIGDSASRAEFDLDVYLEGSVYFELYGTLLFASLDTFPVQGYAGVKSALRSPIPHGIWLNEIAVDDQDQLVLVLGQQHRPLLYLVASGWALDEWEELPEDEPDL